MKDGRTRSRWSGEGSEVWSRVEGQSRAGGVRVGGGRRRSVGSAGVGGAVKASDGGRMRVTEEVSVRVAGGSDEARCRVIAATGRSAASGRLSGDRDRPHGHAQGERHGGRRIGSGATRGPGSRRAATRQRREADDDQEAGLEAASRSRRQLRRARRRSRPVGPRGGAQRRFAGDGRTVPPGAGSGPVRRSAL